MTDKHAQNYGDTVPLCEPPQNGESPPGYYNSGPTMVAVAPQSVAYPPPNGPPPSDYLVMSILTLFFCFWPLGLVGLLKSFEVRSSIARSDYVAANRASSDALRFNKLGILIGVITLVITLVIVVVAQLSWIIPFAVGVYNK